jgi:glutamate/tyrosine decarboxylase-like PLP-dependent enzyme
VTVNDVTPAAPDHRFADEAEGIELVNQRIAQIQQLRARIEQIAVARRGRPSVTLADELSLTVFRHYEAKFMLDQLVAQLKRLQQRRKRLMASALPKAARTVAR